MGTYISRSDIEDRFGTDNVSKWADMNNDNDTTEIADRITDAISFAEAFVEGRLRGTRYQIPLSISSGSDLIKDIVRAYAAEWLFSNRIHKDDEDNAKRNWIRGHVQRADQLLNMIAGGSIRLDATLSHDGPTIPQVVA